MSKLNFLFSGQFIQTPVLAAVVFTYLVLITYTDIKEQRIPDHINLAMIVIRLVLFMLMPQYGIDIIWTVLIIVSTLIPAMVANKPMGGDLKALAVLSLYMGQDVIGFALVFMAVGLVLGSAYSAMKGDIKTVMPMAPFMLLSYILCIGIWVQCL